MHTTQERHVIHVVGAVMLYEGRCFAARRAPHKSGAGQWEFPGGKPEAGESHEQALARELREEFGIEVEVGPWLTRTESTLDPLDGGALIRLDLYLVRHVSGDFRPTDHDTVGWYIARELEGLEWAKADLDALPFVLGATKAHFYQHNPVARTAQGDADWVGMVVEGVEGLVSRYRQPVPNADPTEARMVERALDSLRSAVWALTSAKVWLGHLAAYRLQRTTQAQEKPTP